MCVLQYAEDIKHKTTLLELQKMFTYLMVSVPSSAGPPVLKDNTGRGRSSFTRDLC